MQGSAGIGTQADDIPGVLRYFWLVEDNVKWHCLDCAGFTYAALEHVKTLTDG